MTVHEVITSNIIKKLEDGVVPWKLPWDKTSGYPRNIDAKDGEHYHGINILMTVMQRYASPFWLTFNQIQKKGGRIKKGEHATPLIYAKTTEDDEGARHFFYRYYRVWNTTQCIGIPTPDIPVNTRINNPIAAADAIVAGWTAKPEIRHGYSQACYVPATDQIHMPNIEVFNSSEDYYDVLFHEMTHATGHDSRLARNFKYTGREYAYEELVAEIGGAFLSNQAGFVDRTIDNSASYIDYWLNALKGDSKLVLTAAAKAQKAYELITESTNESRATVAA